jgi:hypothetical protein
MDVSEYHDELNSVFFFKLSITSAKLPFVLA